MTSLSSNFFAEPEEQSRVKSAIVSKYFKAWVTIILSTQMNNERKYPGHKNTIAYVDFYAGPGKYDNGEFATPLLIIREAQSVPGLPERMSYYFNDSDENNVGKLKNNIQDMFPGLKSSIHFYNEEVGTNFIDFMKAKPDNTVSFCFIDPFGYAGVTRELIAASLQGWGSEVIFFFNFNRVRMAINNPIVEKHMQELFGDRLDTLRELLSATNGYSQEEKEVRIMNLLYDSIRTAAQEQAGADKVYMLPFCFKAKKGSRTSHYIIQVTKHVRGFMLMKDVMAKKSSSVVDDVPNFTFLNSEYTQGSLRELLEHPLEDLADELLNTYAGRQITTLALIEDHTIHTLFTKNNYKTVLYQLFADKRIQVNRSPQRANTFADDIVIMFPPR